MGKSVCSKHEVAYENHCPWCEFPEAEASDRDWAVSAYSFGGAPIVPTNPDGTVGGWLGIATSYHAPQGLAAQSQQGLVSGAALSVLGARGSIWETATLSPRWKNVWGCICGAMTFGKPDKCSNCGRTEP